MLMQCLHTTTAKCSASALRETLNFNRTLIMANLTAHIHVNRCRRNSVAYKSSRLRGKIELNTAVLRLHKDKPVIIRSSISIRGNALEIVNMR